MTVATSQILAPIELAWLRVQTPESPMVTTVGMICEGSIDREAFKSRIEDRLLGEKRLRQRIETPHLPLSRPSWQEVEQFQLADHLLVEDTSEQGLPEVIARLGSQPLTEGLPLWQIHLIERQEGGSVVVFRLHASVADSRAAASMAMRLFDSQTEDPAARSKIGFEHLIKMDALRAGEGRTASATRALCQLITSRADRSNPFRCKATGSRIAAWSDPVDLEILERRSVELHCSVTEALVSAIVTGLRKAVHQRDLPAEDLDLKAVVPLDLRLPGARLHGTLRDEIGRFSSSPERLVVLGIEAGVNLSMSELEERSLRLMSQKASASMAILDGPAEAQSLCGQTVSQLVWQRAMPGRIALSLSLVAYAGRVQFGISCDEELEMDPSVLASDMAQAATAT
jgi:hypothetical protein